MYMHGTDASPAGYFAVIQRSWDFPEQFNALQPYDKTLQSTSHHTSYSPDTPVFQLVQANTHGGICGNDGTSLGSTATQTDHDVGFIDKQCCSRGDLPGPGPPHVPGGINRAAQKGPLKNHMDRRALCPQQRLIHLQVVCISVEQGIRIVQTYLFHV